MKRTNENEEELEESVEGRNSTEGNIGQAAVFRTQGRGGTSIGLAGVRKVARERKDARFTALLHHVNRELLRESYYALKREAAAGVDGVTWRAYGEGLEHRIADLHDRIHAGTYRAQPSKRAYIRKEDGGRRPLGISALEDKIAQKAVSTVLEQIYEEDFLGFSYGFRPGRSPHNALDALWVAITQRKVSWVLDADIRGFYDTIIHEWMLKFIEHRIADPRILRLIRKWLRAGVSEEGEWSKTEIGTPQGAVISPLLANIYLHYVLDLWVNRWRREHARGEVIVVRYADDFVLGFQYRSDAERFREGLQLRLARFGLELNPEKTRLIEFGRFAIDNRRDRGDGKPETFDFLGFTHMCSKRKDGRFTVRRKSAAKRVRTALRRIRRELKMRRHEPIPQQGQWLKAVVQGYFNYHAVPDNKDTLDAFRSEVSRAWRRSLSRRSQKGRVTWDCFRGLAKRWIPTAKLVHPPPNLRLIVPYPR